MKILFRIFILLPIALVLLLFAIANRHVVTVSFDPFPGTEISGPSLTAPLFIALTIAAFAGLLVGGFVAWLGQGRARQEARRARADASAARADADRLRADLLAARVSAETSTGTALVPVRRDAA